MTLCYGKDENFSGDSLDFFNLFYTFAVEYTQSVGCIRFMGKY
jgi:hypothetical protein